MSVLSKMQNITELYHKTVCKEDSSKTDKKPEISKTLEKAD